MNSARILEFLETKGLKIALAESLTGGLLSSELVSNPGASRVVLGSVVAYQTGLKTSLLGVSSDFLAEVGAVDPEVALRMAEGVRSRFSLNLLLSTDKVIGVSTTGVAGPDPQDGKPVGLVFIGVSGPKGNNVWEDQFSGSRQEIREKTVQKVFEHLGEYLGL